MLVIFHLLTAQMLVAAQMGSAINLSTTIIVLRLFYQKPGTTMSRRLRYFAFKILAPLTLFDVKAFINVDECVKGAKIVPAETELKSAGENSESEQDSTNEKRSKETQTERHYNEWQVLAMSGFIILSLLLLPTPSPGQ